MLRCDNKSWSFLERDLGLILSFRKVLSDSTSVFKHWYNTNVLSNEEYR